MKLYPPYIDRQLPAFTGTMLTVPFTLNRAVGRKDFDKVSIIIKSVQSNQTKINNKTTEIIGFDDVNKKWIASFDLANEDFKPLIGQFYKIQIAFVNGDEVGYYSTVGVMKYTTNPILSIKNLQNNKGTNYHEFEYTGVYRQYSEDKEYDRTEKEYSYCFNIYDKNYNLHESSGELIHNSSYDVESYESTDTWIPTKTLNSNEWYTITYSVKTINGLDVTSQEYKIIQMDTVDMNLPGYLTATLNFDDGYISVQLKNNLGNNKKIRGDFVLVRASSEDNYTTWNQIYYFNLLNELPNREVWKDFTIQQGVHYKYAIQAYNEYDLFSNRMENIEGPVYADFEDAFLFDGERQLKIRFNPHVSSFKPTLLESKTDTIGSKYPFIFRNGNVEYKEFPIQGLLSYLSDPFELFLNIYPHDDKKRDKTSSAAAGIKDAGLDLDGELIKRERDFKLSALKWLTNGEPKLFKSPVEGNYIVRLLNVSLNPEDVVGRMLHNFNCTAYEVATYNFINLKNYGFIGSGVDQTKVEMHFEVLDLMELFGTATPEIGATITLKEGAYFLFFRNQRHELLFDIRFLNSVNKITVDVGNVTGDYNLPIVDSPAVELIYKGGSVDHDASVVYGYYDKSLPTGKSIIAKMEIEDRIEQFWGTNPTVNVLDGIEDIRTKFGSIYYLRINHKNIERVYHIGDQYYYDRFGAYPFRGWDGKTLFFVENENIWYAGSPDNRLTEQPNYLAKFNNEDYLDFSRHVTQRETESTSKVETSSRYDLIRNIGEITNLQLGSGLVADLVYQVKTIEYTMESTDKDLIDAKSAWETNKERYSEYLKTNTDDSLDDFNTQVKELKRQVDNSYNRYIRLLERKINNLKEEGYNYVL